MMALPPQAADHRLRPMTVGDLDTVMAIEQQAYAFPWTRGNMTDSLAAGHPAWLLLGEPNQPRRRAERQPVCLGYYVAMQGVDELHLLNITVHPEHQGQGWGRTMLSHLGQLACDLAARQVWLEVRQSNQRARALYERWGFEAVGRRKAYYPAAGQREDAVVMRWNLASEAAMTSVAAQPPAARAG
jgi:ribosomal-protein-alanine N-acetyltransferase